MLFSIRAYSSKSEGERGRNSPLYSSSTGNFDTAKHTARSLAKDYGCSVVENKETGNRTWLRVCQFCDNEVTGNSLNTVCDDHAVMAA